MISLSRQQVVLLFMEYSFHSIRSAYLLEKYPNDFSDYAGESILDMVIKNLKIDKKDLSLVDKAYRDFFDIVFRGIEDEKKLRLAFENYLDWLENVSKK